MCVCVSALVLGVLVVQQPDMRKGKVASLALALALPLAVHVDLGHFYHVSDLQKHTQVRI